MAHFSRQRRLIADRRRNTAEQRRHFRARLREAEHVVDEEQNVLALIAEVLGDRQTGQRDTARAPGGSFIWPNTSAQREPWPPPFTLTFDFSIIS